VIRCGLLLLILLSSHLPAIAQSQPPAEPAPDGAEFLARYDFHLAAEYLSHEDPRFVWDTNFGGELDAWRKGSTQVTLVANYQAMLGEEFRAFDPNQGNYILSAEVTTRPGGLGGLLVGPVFYHQSRHLSDRDKRQSIDWNMLGGMVGKTVEQGATRVEARLDLRGTVHKTYVDYDWELDTGVRLHHRLTPHVSAVGGGSLRYLGVDGSRDRGNQTGFRADGGLGFDGRAGLIELFVAVERRIDPYQLQFGTATWASVGMRLLSR
jgi:hypothetical protein